LVYPAQVELRELPRHHTLVQRPDVVRAQLSRGRRLRARWITVNLGLYNATYTRPSLHEDAPNLSPSVLTMAFHANAKYQRRLTQAKTTNYTMVLPQSRPRSCRRPVTERDVAQMQGFEWYTDGGGTHWRTLATQAPELGSMGITAMWIPRKSPIQSSSSLALIPVCLPHSTDQSIVTGQCRL
jgi:hypothetical protein